MNADIAQRLLEVRWAIRPERAKRRSLAHSSVARELQ
jgi:hypothetical protein